MKNLSEKEAYFKAIDAEYSRSAPEALRLKIRALMQLPLVKPWQFAGSVALLFASPLSLFLFRDRLVYSANMLLVLNICAGLSAFMIIFAGVAHHYGDPKNKADFLERLNALRARF